LTFAALGHARDSGRSVFVAQSDRIEELPRIISVPCARFLLLLAYNHGRTPTGLVDALGALLDRGCVYLCVWGHGCEHVHDTMDDIVLERELKGGPEQTIMTTWHDKQSLEEALDFALRHAVPDGALVQGCDAIVLAAVGGAESLEAVRGMAQRYLLPSVL
jgi:hypothetical protein